MGCGCGGRSFSGGVGTPRRSVPAQPVQYKTTPPKPGQAPASAPTYLVQSQMLAQRRAAATRRQV
jgi:hypothetical protein